MCAKSAWDKFPRIMAIAARSAFSTDSSSVLLLVVVVSCDREGELALPSVVVVVVVVVAEGGCAVVPARSCVLCLSSGEENPPGGVLSLLAGVVGRCSDARMRERERSRLKPLRPVMMQRCHVKVRLW